MVKNVKFQVILIAGPPVEMRPEKFPKILSQLIDVPYNRKSHNMLIFLLRRV